MDLLWKKLERKQPGRIGKSSFTGNPFWLSNNSYNLIMPKATFYGLSNFQKEGAKCDV